MTVDDPSSCFSLVANIHLYLALSSYNLYFKWVRELVLKGEAENKRQATDEELLRIRDEHQKASKRSHKKSHGKVSFQELNLIIAKKWKETPALEKNIFERHASLEKQEYNQKFERWQMQQSAIHNASHLVIRPHVALQQHQQPSSISRQWREDPMDLKPYPLESSIVQLRGGYESASGGSSNDYLLGGDITRPSSEEQKMSASQEEAPRTTLLDNEFLSHRLSQYDEDDLSSVDMEPRPIREERSSSLSPLEISNLQWQAYPFNDLYEPVMGSMDSVFDD